MSNATESVLNGKHDVSALRIAELEAENERLRAENQRLSQRVLADSAIRDAYFLQGLPRNQEEYREMVANARPFRELMAELEKKHGLGV